MSLFTTKTPAAPVDPALIAAETTARIEAEQALGQARREQEVRESEHRARMATLKDGADTASQDRRRQKRALVLTKVRTLAPLLIVNAAAVYGQLDYAYREVAPTAWNQPLKVALAVMFALAVESIALYIQWHAHDALLMKAYATAARLRRASYAVAGVVAAINYTHFAGNDAGEDLAPTAAAVAFGLLSLLSPWLWGLHTRRAEHVQLLAEDANLIDDGGAEFSAERRRAFPYRSWQARRWSIDHSERDPKVAWREYNAERVTAKALRASRRAESGVKRAAEGDALAAAKAAGGDAPAGVVKPPVPAGRAASEKASRVRHHRLIRTVRVTHPKPRVTAAQEPRQDVRAPQEIDLAARVMSKGDPALPKRTIAHLIGTSESKVRRALRRDQNPEPPPRINGNAPELEAVR